MLTAVLYARVSTDEQAIRGYSQRSQQDRLTKYCLVHDIEILSCVLEDHSAQSFNRPAWSEMMAGFRRNKLQRPDLLLFTKWDRFSRNAAEAYYAIRLLQKLGIEPQAIEQPLDLSVPENKILLAVYIATSEVENDRRSLNVRQGIHKAREEGRWTSHAPLGYSFRLSENGNKCLSRKEPEAAYIQRAFMLISKNDQQNIHSIYKQLVKEGLLCSRSHFWRILRNPVYCGKVLVPAFENAPKRWIHGLHEALVSESLFQEVQRILSERRHCPASRVLPLELLFLRGLVCCPNCGGVLTGSGSKGKRARYYYYHCHHCCRFRVRADTVHKQLLSALGQLKARKEYQEAYRSILTHIRKDFSTEHMTNQKSLIQSIHKLIERILKAKELSISGEIEYDDFQLIKVDCEKRIHTLGIELQHVASLNKSKKKHLLKIIQQLSQLTMLWQQWDFFTRRKLLALLLHDQPVLQNGPWFEAAVRKATCIIYDLKVAGSLILSTSGSTAQSHLQPEFYNQMVSRTMRQGSGSDCAISEQEAREVVAFLTDFAVLSTKHVD